MKRTKCAPNPPIKLRNNQLFSVFGIAHVFTEQFTETDPTQHSPNSRNREGILTRDKTLDFRALYFTLSQIPEAETLRTAHAAYLNQLNTLHIKHLEACVIFVNYLSNLSLRRADFLSSGS